MLCLLIIQIVMIVYKGIRYATAERFGSPKQEPRLSSLNGIETAMRICPQNPSRLEGMMGGTNGLLDQSEDCLRLAIYSPSTDRRLPVLVWIHGGAFLTGSGLYDKYDATDLAREGDIVVVCISYRLGAFGFLYDPEHGIVNVGIQDQVCALRWIRDNIGLFGGDPDDVTIFGQSAGGYSVLHHIANVTETLFSKAIIASAPFFKVKRNALHKTTQTWYKEVGGRTVAHSVGEMLKAQKMIADKHFTMPFCAVGDDVTKPSAVAPGLKAVKLWCQQDDASAFVPYKSASKFITSLIFRKPMYRYTSRLKGLGVDASCNVLKWRHGTSPWGAAHCMELPLLFGDFDTWKRAPFMEGVSIEEYKHQAALLRKDLLMIIHQYPSCQ